jgi:ribose 5-phosphate isomerase B
MKIGIGSDHSGFGLKKELKAYLKEDFPDIEVVDYGPKDTNSTDYPIYGAKVAKAVANGEVDRGILICGTGIGITMTAGKVKGVRAALCHDAYTAKLSRLHNDANIISMGSRVIGSGVAKDMLKVWLETEFEGGGRHERRVRQIHDLTC